MEIFKYKLLFLFFMSKENNNIVLERMLGNRNELKESFLEGLAYASPFCCSCSDEPVPVMPGKETERAIGWFAGGTLGYASIGVLLYGVARIVTQIIDYI